MARKSFGAFGNYCALLVILTCACVMNAKAASLSDIEFSNSSINVRAGAGTVTVTADRVGDPSGSAIAIYKTFDGSALAGTDYVATTGTLSWNDGDGTPKSFTLPILPNAEGGSSFSVALIYAGGAFFGNPISSTISIAAQAANVFPKIGVTTNSGSQLYAPANDALLAQYGLIILGGNFPSWPESEGRTRDQLVLSLKSQTHTGRNALTPVVFQYENANELDLANPWFPEWNSAVIRNNWFLYTFGASGLMTASPFDPSYVMVNPDKVVGTDSITGLYPYGLLAYLLYDRYYLGTGSGGPGMASTHLDGYFVDNLTQQDLAGSAADWERNGTNPSQTDPTATAAVTQGKAQYPAELQALNANIVAGGNSEAGYDMSPQSVGGLGMTYSGLTGKLGLAMQEFEWATAGGYSNVLNFGGFNEAMTWYQTLENNTQPGGYVLIAGGVLASDYQLVRYSLGLTLMRNGWAIYAIDNGGNDVVDPSNLATFPVFDEFWGGTLNTAGYLGVPLDTVQGAEQSAPWLQGVWRRDFANGIVLVNPNINSAQTVALGGTFYHLHGSQVPSINNGAAVTSVTIAPGDGVILLRSQPAP
jgi:hypothetical protein